MVTKQRILRIILIMWKKIGFGKFLDYGINIGGLIFLLFLSYRVVTLEKQNEILSLNTVWNENMILNQNREFLLKQSLGTLSLLDCEGMPKQAIDSMQVNLYRINMRRYKLDSVYIQERLQMIKEGKFLLDKKDSI